MDQVAMKPLAARMAEVWNLTSNIPESTLKVIPIRSFESKPLAIVCICVPLLNICNKKKDKMPQCSEGEKRWINPLKSKRVLALSKLKALTDDNVTISQNSGIFFDRTENNLGKGVNAGNQHFLLFPLFFPKASFPVSLKVSIVRKRVKLFQLNLVEN